MRTVLVDIKPNHPAAPYLGENTAESRAVRNTANFLIRNAMTGLRKPPEERTHTETEALHTVFTGIQKANAHKEAMDEKAVFSAFRKIKSGELTGLKAHAFLKSKLEACGKRFRYPTAQNWFLNYETLDAILKHTGNAAYYSCTSQVNQQAIRKTAASWKSYFQALKDWNRNPGKYQAKPRIPGYIREREATAHFTNQVCRLVHAGGRLYLGFANCDQFVCLGNESLIPGKLVKVEAKPRYSRYRLCITYEDALQEPAVPAAPKRILGLDVGVTNFLAGVSNTGAAPFLIKGGWLKSLNQWYNKRRAKLMSAVTKGSDSKHSRKTSRALSALSRKRDDKIRDFFYKTAHWIMRWCVERRIEVIVIGCSKEMKQEISIGSINNQNFVTIPYERFRSILKVVGCRYGIPVIEQEESYTSKASLLDLDEVPVYGKEDADTAVFSGNRAKRGMYVSREGKLINADINGAGNILRKAYPYAFNGVKMEYLCSAVSAIAGEQVLHKKHKAPVKHYHRHRSAAGKVRHFYRQEKRMQLRMVWENRDDTYKKKNRPPAKAAA